MPKFIDYHPQMPPMPPDMATQMQEMVESTGASLGREYVVEVNSQV